MSSSSEVTSSGSSIETSFSEEAVRRASSIVIPKGKGVTVKFSNLSLDVPVIKEANNPCERIAQSCKTKETRRIMHDVTGSIGPGDCIALMGASGAGKSTLLNLLSQRVRNHEGTVLYNDEPAAGSVHLKHNSCFIQQQDIFMGFLTCEEHLTGQSEIRLPVSDAARKQRVDDVIGLFGMNKIRGGQVGNVAQRAKKGISGGEKKRLSVATEILTNPALVFADEPTSGLDAFLAESVVDVLAGLAAAGHTVITTIHQPSSHVFQRFNKLMLLSEGSIIYFGPRQGAIPYFARLDFVCPAFSNPADFYIESLAIDWEKPDKKLAQLTEWREKWSAEGETFLAEWDSKLKHKFQEDADEHDSSAIQRALAEINENFKVPTDEGGVPFRVSNWSMYKTLVTRCWTQTVRDPGVVRVRSLHLTISALILALVYFQLDDDMHYSKAGACFSILLFQGMPATLSVLTAFVTQKPIILREGDAHLYPLPLFYLAKMTSDFPFQAIVPVFFTTLVWWCVGLNNSAGRFFEAMFVCFLVTQALTSFGYLVAAIARSVAIGLALAPLIIMPFLIVSGFVINLASLHPFWTWLVAISPIKYGFHGTLIATFLDTKIEANCPPIGVDNMLKPCYGNTILDYYQAPYEGFDRYLNWIYCTIILVVVRIIGGCLFYLLNRGGSKGQ